MNYVAPLDDIHLALRDAGLDRLVADGIASDASPDVVDSVLEEAAKFAQNRIAPLDRDSDKTGARFADGSVTSAPGFAAAYQDFVAAGWNALPGPVAYGGQGLPVLLNSACVEIWNAASLSFGLAPLLTMGAVEALTAHGTSALKERYLAKLVSGEWTGTMNLTEPQAGSDLSLLRTKAERTGDGSYRITGQKIYITYGEHDMAGNILHLVLARLPDAPPGTRGISLFLVPKFLPDGSRNEVRCGGIERKLGIHGSPTCIMLYGDGGGATGYLIGEENKGLACMFTMMNNARLAVALQGVAIADRATQRAIAYAKERKQGRAPGSTSGPDAILAHPDVRRMVVTMRGKTLAARALCYEVAEALDRASHGDEAAAARAALMTPVAKAFATDAAVEVASLGVQVHGGMGFVEDTGAAQHLRDARILPIYEGTNGIQAIDLVQRKLPLDGGAIIAARIAALRADLQRISASNAGLDAAVLRTKRAADALEKTTAYMLEAVSHRPADALAGATPYLELLALTAGGTALLRQAVLEPGNVGRAEMATFFAGNLTTKAEGLAEMAMEGEAGLGKAAL